MGRNNRALLEGAGYSFEYSGDEYTHKVNAHHDGNLVGSMSWQAQDQPKFDMVKSEVKSNDVVPEHRGKGIATAMWHFAHEVAKKNPNVVAPTHSRTRTPAGDAWVKKVSPKDYTPPERLL